MIIAKTLAAQRCAVVVAARRRRFLDDLTAQIIDLGGQAVAVTCDVRDPGHGDLFAEECVSRRSGT